MHITLAQMVADMAEQSHALWSSESVIGPQVDRRCAYGGAAVCHDATVSHDSSNTSLLLENQSFRGGIVQLVRQLFCRPDRGPVQIGGGLVQHLRALFQISRAALTHVRIGCMRRQAEQVAQSSAGQPLPSRYTRATQRARCQYLEPMSRAEKKMVLLREGASVPCPEAI